MTLFCYPLLDLVERTCADPDGELRIEDLKHYLKYEWRGDPARAVSHFGSALYDALHNDANDQLDRSTDMPISTDEIPELSLSLFDEVIRVVDQDGDEKISAKGLGNAASPSKPSEMLPLSKALANFLDGPGNDLIEDLSGLLSKYIPAMITALDDAIKSDHQGGGQR